MVSALAADHSAVCNCSRLKLLVCTSYP